LHKPHGEFRISEWLEAIGLVLAAQLVQKIGRDSVMVELQE
jgi:hypothetical protein